MFGSRGSRGGGSREWCDALMTAVLMVKLGYIRRRRPKSQLSRHPDGLVFANTYFVRAKKNKGTLGKLRRSEAARCYPPTYPNSTKMAEDRLTEQSKSLCALEAALQPAVRNSSKEQKKTAHEIMKGAGAEPDLLCPITFAPHIPSLACGYALVSCLLTSDGHQQRLTQCHRVRL